MKSADDETGKAFAELEKNDKDDTSKAFGNDAGAPRPTHPESRRGRVSPTAGADPRRDQAGRTYRYRSDAEQTDQRYAITFRSVDDGGAEVHTGGDR